MTFDMSDVALCRAFDCIVSIFSNVLVESIVDPFIGKRSEEGDYSAHSDCVQRDFVWIAVYMNVTQRGSATTVTMSPENNSPFDRHHEASCPNGARFRREMAAGSNDVDAGDWRDRIP